MAREQRHNTTLLKHYKKLLQNEKIQTRVSRARVARKKPTLKNPVGKTDRKSGVGGGEARLKSPTKTAKTAN